VSVPCRSSTPHTGVSPRQIAEYTATCTTVPDPASQLRRAPTPPRVMWLRTPPPYWGGLRRCHMSHNFRPASLLRMATTLPRVPRLQTRLPVGEGSGTAAGLKYKGSHHWLSRAFKIHVFPRRTCTQVPKAHAYSATMSDKGRTRLTDATTTSKTGITRQQVATVQPPATIRC
jgi:hypothetical protein